LITQVFEKAGINVSVVYGQMPPEAYRAATGEGANTAIPEGVQWYDEPTRQKVVDWFLDDFALFNFSTTPPADLGSAWDLDAALADSDEEQL